VELLLEHYYELEVENIGKNVCGTHHPSPESDRPLHLASATGSLEVVTLLLDRW
jgi:hypothetical protein